MCALADTSVQIPLWQLNIFILLHYSCGQIVLETNPKIKYYCDLIMECKLFRRATVIPNKDILARLFFKSYSSEYKYSAKTSSD